MSFKPTDAYITGHWYFDIPGLVSPHFQNLEGINRETGEVTVVDGKTNITHKFSAQIKKFGDITLTRPYDGSVDDLTMNALYKKCEDQGFRFDGSLVKMHNGQEVFRILFLGVRIKKLEHPSLATESEGRYDIKYSCSVSQWEEVR
jgi:hypothetical protein